MIGQLVVGNKSQETHALPQIQPRDLGFQFIENGSFIGGEIFTSGRNIKHRLRLPFCH